MLILRCDHSPGVAYVARRRASSQDKPEEVRLGGSRWSHGPRELSSAPAGATPRPALFTRRMDTPTVAPHHFADGSLHEFVAGHVER